MFSTPTPASSHLGRPPSPAGRIADIDRTIRFWQRRGVRMVDAASTLRCTRTWAKVRARMMQIAARWER